MNIYIYLHVRSIYTYIYTYVYNHIYIYVYIHYVYIHMYDTHTQSNTSSIYLLVIRECVQWADHLDTHLAIKGVREQFVVLEQSSGL